MENGLLFTNDIVNSPSPFVKGSYAGFSGLKIVFPDHNVALWPQTRPNLGKKNAKDSPKTSLSALVGSQQLLNDPTMQGFQDS